MHHYWARETSKNDMKHGADSDFVTNYYGESWDSFWEKS